MGLEGRSLVSINDLAKGEIEHILDVSRSMEKERKPLLGGKILANMFFEPSTRTMLSFESAMLRLGGGVLGFSEVDKTSIAKGESVEDTVRVIEGYADIGVLRNWKEGIARKCADIAKIPLINAGDGSREHPTQALLDLYTIRKSLGKIDDLEIAISGDLKYGRTVHSLVKALNLYDVNLRLVSPIGLEMPKDVLKCIDIPYTSHNNFDEVIKDIDVLYVTRIQRERFQPKDEYEKHAGSYRIDMKLLKQGKDNLIVMHPLPRVDEICIEVDNEKYCKYFEQARNGVFVRMATLCLLLGAVK